ncbi:MAG TPA: hypothetical protein PLO37_13730 [Candidatus Hydrogenedentes bacterium]|nr:hypothetical protein [Candidatus Hydrogenedentota bacterium]HPG67905.1 hypothetical protein [Candidatus Hydrogenedentota bacterium]
MAEEERVEQTKPKSGSVGKIVLIVVLIIVPAMAALATYRFVLAPMFAPPEEQQAPPESENKIPLGAVMVDFSELRATVDTGNPNKPALLQYSVTMACANSETLLLIEAWRQLFQAMLVRLHDSRTKDELVDAAAKDEMLRQIKQEANTILKRIQKSEDSEVRVLEVMYTEYTVLDL